MPITKGQNYQDVNDAALNRLGLGARSGNDTIMAGIDQEFDAPLRLWASITPDANLNISASEVSKSNTAGKSAGFTSFAASTINFQTGATTGGTISISFPSTTIGFFTRCALTLLPDGTVKAIFATPNSVFGSVPAPTFIAGGYAIGWIDLQATAASAFKTIGSASSIIENSTSSTVRIHNSGCSRVLASEVPHLVRGGNWGWTLSTTTLTWDADAFVQIPGLAEARNKISTGSNAGLTADGMVLYASLNLTSGSNATLTLQTAAIGSVVPDETTFILARRLGNAVLLADFTQLSDGETQQLNTDLSNQNFTLLGSGVTSATSNPNYSGRGAPDRTIGNTQGFADAIASIDTQIDKFFGQLQIQPHATLVNRVLITGVDFTMLNNVILSQELNGYVVAFTGAQIDFTTGSVYQSDGTTPLGINFTPITIPTSSYAWYGIAALVGTVGSDNTVSLQMQVSPATAANASPSLAPKPNITGSKKSGAVLVQNVAGTITVTTIRQLGVGSGSSSSGGTGTAATSPASGFNLLMTDYFTSSKSQDANLNATFTNASLTPAPTTANPTTSVYAMSCDKTKTFTTVGTGYTISGTPSYTVAVGDIIYSGGNFRRIVTVTTQTTGVLDAAFSPNLSGSAGMVSQAVWTNDLVNVGDSTQLTRPRDFYPSTNISSINLSYHDSLTAADGTPDYTTTARVVASASNFGLYTNTSWDVTGDTFSTIFTRPAAPNQVPDYSLLSNANKQRLFLVFFPNPSNGSVTTLANLSDFEVSFYAQSVLLNGGYLQSAFCFSDGSGVAVNCSNPAVVLGKTRVALSWSYVPGLNAGQTTGDLEVIVDGQIIPRLVGSTTLDAYYTETPSTTNTIDLWTDLSGYQRSIEIRRRQGTIDTSSQNSIIVAAMDDIRVGTAAQVTSGAAQYSSLQTALGTLPSGGKILLVGTPITENITISNANVMIEGKGKTTQITGTITISSGADYCLIRAVRITDNVTMSSNYSYIREAWLASGKKVTITSGTTGNDAEYMPNS